MLNGDIQAIQFSFIFSIKQIQISQLCSYEIPSKVLILYKKQKLQLNNFIKNLSKMKTLVYLGLSLAIIAGTLFFIQKTETDYFDLNASQHYGNMTAAMKQHVKDAMQLASYKYQDLDDMSQYIGDTLDKVYGQSWQVHIYGSGCDITQGASKSKYYSRWAWFTNYGPKDQCFYVFQTHNCRTMTSKQLMDKSKYKQSGEDWGNSITAAEKLRIKEVIRNATAYTSEPYGNAKYILDRMGTAYWSVNLGDPKQHDFGFYACIVGDYWGLVWDIGIYGWDYVIYRYN